MEKIKQFLYFLGIVVLLACFVFLGIQNVRLVKKYKEFKLKSQELESQVEETEKENQELRFRISHSEDLEYLEKIAREELNLKKAGEEVVAFPLIDKKEKESNKREYTWSFWQKILRNLKGE